MANTHSTTDLPEKANLGCGDEYRDGWMNVDIRESVNPDAVTDLNDIPWTLHGDPIPDGAFQEIILDNVLEHLDDHLAVIQELARVTRPGGTVTVGGPHWNSPGAWIDPTHTRPFDPRTFNHALVDHLFRIESVDVHRVRFGRVLPERAAWFLADHIGHIVSGFHVELTRMEGER